jgi:Sec-independent protein secretion pathway component TatC
VSQLVVSGPLMLLYELSILLAARAVRSRERSLGRLKNASGNQ